MCLQGFVSVLIQHYGAITTCQDVNSRRVIIIGHSNTTQTPLGASVVVSIFTQKKSFCSIILLPFIYGLTLYFCFFPFLLLSKHDYFSS